MAEAKSGISLYMLLTVALCIAKAAGVIPAVPWFWCFAPLWLPVVTMLVLWAGAAILVLVLALVVVIIN